MMPCYLLQGPWGRVTRVSCQPVAECGGTHTVQRLSAERCSVRRDGEPKTEREGEKERERERWSSLPLSTDHNTRCWWHATPSPPALALGCISHYLHHFRCCNQQMEQPPWKVFLSFWANPSKVKGRKKTRQEDRMKKKKKPISSPVLLTCMERKDNLQPSITYNKYNTV